MTLKLEFNYVIAFILFLSVQHDFSSSLYGRPLISVIILDYMMNLPLG